MLENIASRRPSAYSPSSNPERIVNFGPAWEYKPDAVLLEKVEDNDVSLVLLRIRWSHFSRVEKRRRIPFDLLANLLIGTQNDRYAEPQQHLPADASVTLHVSIHFFRLRTALSLKPLWFSSDVLLVSRTSIKFRPAFAPPEASLLPRRTAAQSQRVPADTSVGRVPYSMSLPLRRWQVPFRLRRPATHVP